MFCDIWFYDRTVLPLKTFPISYPSELVVHRPCNKVPAWNLIWDKPAALGDKKNFTEPKSLEDARSMKQSM